MERLTSHAVVVVEFDGDGAAGGEFHGLVAFDIDEVADEVVVAHVGVWSGEPGVAVAFVSGVIAPAGSFTGAKDSTGV